MSNRRRKTNLLLDQDNITSEESSMGEGSSESIHVPINYLEQIDDDVVECSPRAFVQVYVRQLFYFIYYYPSTFFILFIIIVDEIFFRLQHK